MKMRRLTLARHSRKALFACAPLAAAALVAGSASAADVTASASHDGTAWVISLPIDLQVCAGDVIRFHDTNSATVTVNNTTYTSFATAIIFGKPSFIVMGTEVPAGALSNLTFRGQSAFNCGPDRVLLPGYVAPIPTLSEWAMILLGVALASGAALTIHRRRTI